MLPQPIIHGFGFEKDNPVWKATLMLIDASIESETAYALQKENRGEDRAYHCGRAEALVSFKSILLTTREAVLRDIGRPLDE
jgi:hypothetical protein